MTRVVADRQDDSADFETGILTLLAESLRVGAICLARLVNGDWLIGQLHDPAAIGLQVGATLPYSTVYGRILADGNTPFVAVEDLRADVRFAAAASTSEWDIGALTAVPLASADGRVYGALCTFHPHARLVSSRDLPLLELAGRMIMQAKEAAAARERELERARRAAEELARLRQSESYFRLLADNAADILGRFAADGTVLHVSPACEALLGYRPEEMAGHSVREFEHPDDREADAQFLAATDSVATMRHRLRHKDGHWVWFETTRRAIRDLAAGKLMEFQIASRDITEKRRIEERLRFQATLLDAVGQAVVATDLQGFVTYFNHAAEIMYGWTAAELIGQNASEVIAALSSVKEQAQIADALSRRESWSGEFMVRRRDGRVFPALVTVNPIIDVEGTLTGIVSVGMDISERKQAEASITASEAQYRRLVELAQEGIWQIDAADQTVYVNQKMADLLGYSTGEILGMPISAFLDDEWKAVVALRFTHTQHAAPADFDLKLLGKDRREVWVHITASAFFDDHGRYLGGMAMFTDISRRKKEERALEDARTAAEELARLRKEQVEEAEAMSAVSSALAGTLEPDRIYSVILEQVERIMHCDHTCVLLYQDGWATVAASRGVAVQPDGTRAFPVAAIEPVMAYGSNGRPALIVDTAVIHWIDVPPLVGEFAIRSSILVPLVLDGVVVGTFNVDSFTPNYYTEAHLTRAVALGERVTQALRNVRLFQLEQRRARTAQELARLKEDFVASVSHELRTPLTAILGYAEILEARWARLDDRRRMEQVHKIVVAANRQHRLVEDLLMLSSLERRELSASPVQVSLADLLHQALEEVRATYSNQRVELIEHCAIEVLADPGRTLQVLVNLLDNAAKYSPESSPVIVGCSVEEGMCVVRVRDFGPGVPEHGRERLFTRFGRLNGSRTRAGRVGTGLGLYISRWLAEEMGGDLDLETTGPEGSTFRLRLPTAPARDENSASNR